MPTSHAIVTAVEFEVVKDLVIADPCYIDGDDDTENLVERLGGLGVVVPDVPGLWRGTIERSEGDWGHRVSILRLQRKGDPYQNTLSFGQIGEAGVDSGQMYAGCSSNLPLDYEALLRCYRTGPDGAWVNHDCLAFGGGIVCSTGYGDGLYRVMANQANALIEVRFLEEWDEEEN